MENKDVKVKLGFVPSHRQMFKRSEPWARELRDRVLKILKEAGFLEVVAPEEKLTGNGLVQNEDDAEKAIRLFKEECVDGVIIMAVDFGDEVSAARIASSLLKPVILFATKEPPFTAEGERISDSFCGTISIGSALYRRKIPFIWGE